MKIKLPYFKEFEWTKYDTQAIVFYILGLIVGRITS